jgi:hypothetical protein
MSNRKLVFMMSVSVDGFFEGPDRELDWQVVGDDPLRSATRVPSAVTAFRLVRSGSEL